MRRKKLPIGIQTFRKIREEDYYYVDKTFFAQRTRVRFVLRQDPASETLYRDLHCARGRHMQKGLSGDRP